MTNLNLEAKEPEEQKWFVHDVACIKQFLNKFKSHSCQILLSIGLCEVDISQATVAVPWDKPVKKECIV